MNNRIKTENKDYTCMKKIITEKCRASEAMMLVIQGRIVVYTKIENTSLKIERKNKIRK